MVHSAADHTSPPEPLSSTPPPSEKANISFLIAIIASQGLTTNELEDILSCDEAVLHDVFQYWTPPIRRLPPLLWVRIRADLSSYLVDRGADATQVICWYHRQFVEAAVDRYLSDPIEKKSRHSAIADYFLGRNFVGRRALVYYWRFTA